MEENDLDKRIARRGLRVCMPISFGMDLSFLLLSGLTGSHLMVDRLGGSVRVGFLSLIGSMPVVISAVKKKFRY